MIASEADQAAIIGAMSPVAREIVDAIGVTATIDLLCRRKIGGKRLFIPPQLMPDSSLIGEVGEAVAQALVACMGYDGLIRVLDVPMLSGVERLLRDNALRADFDAGMNENQLVEKYHLSHRHVRKLLKAKASTSPREERGPRDPHTFDLFKALRSGAGAT